MNYYFILLHIFIDIIDIIVNYYFRIFSMYELYLIQDNELKALHFDEYYGEANTPDFIYF